MKVLADFEDVCCNLCGEDKSQLFLHTQGMNIVKCNNCGLLYVNPQPSEEKLKEWVYSKDYYTHSDGVSFGYTDYLGNKANIVKSFKRSLKAIGKYQPPPGRLLDVGCAFGFFLEVARDNGWDCHGVELCEYSSTYAKEKLGLNVRTGRLEDIQYPDAFFDVIALLDIIEHLKRPSDTLGEVYRILKPGGLITMITPNANSLIANIMKQRWVLYQRPLAHLYYFTSRTLTSMLIKKGFQVIRCKRWGEGGKYVDLGFISRRLKYYSPIFGVMDALIKKLGLEKKSIYADIGDNLVLYAKKSMTNKRGNRGRV